MQDEAKGRVGPLSARIVLWSLISVPGFWVPLCSYYRYPHVDNRTGGIMCISIPLLAIAVVLSIDALVRLQRPLRSRSWPRRGLLTLLALLLSAPTLGALAFMAVTFARVATQRP